MTYRILGDASAIDDQLDFNDYSSILFDIILYAETPLTVGIFGPWGTGKSSLMQMLKAKIDASSSSSTHTIWFNAWKFDREDGLWRAFILRVIDNIRASIKSGIASNENNLVIEELDRLEESLYHTVEWQELGKWTLDWSKAIPSTIKGAAELAFMFVPGAAPFIETLSKAREALAEGKPADELEKVMGAFRRQVKEFRREHLRAIEQFETEFGHIVQSYITKKQGRLIVFVDDLDRCLPEKSIEILEAIKLFLEVPGCVFVVGMDKDIIEKGVAYRYGNHNTKPLEEIISGENYLQKMIQLPFHLPELSYTSVQNFIEKLDGQFLFNEQLPLACREIIAIGCPANPRQIKRTINLFRMLRAVAELRDARGEFSHQISLPLLAKTVVIQAHFPVFYADWIRFPTLIQHLEASYTSPTDDFSDYNDNSSQKDISSSSMSRLLTSYLNDENADSRLGRVITFDLRNNNKTDACKFADLTRTEITTYFYLARTGSERDLIIERSEGDLWHDLMSQDQIRVQDTVEMLESANRRFRHTFESRLISIIEAREGVQSKDKVNAGFALGIMGDPRKLDDMILIQLGKNTDSGQLKYDIYIGKYPVTNSEFRKFLENGYSKKQFWSDDGWNWKEETQREAPAYWNKPQFNQPNQPVVGITWYEAEAYANFKRMRLPTADEWEQIIKGENDFEYPWGDFPTLGYANTSELGIDRTCAVGLFPQGAVRGIYDLAGQVWEWTSTPLNDGIFILKGGSWTTNLEYAQASYQFGLYCEVGDSLTGFRLALDI